jgi:hypothetical protein
MKIMWETRVLSWLLQLKPTLIMIMMLGKNWERSLLVTSILLYHHHIMWRGLYWNHCSVSQSICLHCVHSINPIILEEFSTDLLRILTLTSRCVETMTQLCQVRWRAKLKVKCRIILCLLYNSFTLTRIFFKLGPNVHLKKELCRIFDYAF